MYLTICSAGHCFTCINETYFTRYCFLRFLFFLSFGVAWHFSMHYIVTRKDVSAARENLAIPIVLLTPLMGPFNVNLSIHMAENSFSFCLPSSPIVSPSVQCFLLNPKCYMDLIQKVCRMLDNVLCQCPCHALLIIVVL